jgi:AcrR family transcriptional regulator
MSFSPQTPVSAAISPATSRRARRSAATRESLFRAALDLFACKGFAETTVEDITQAADVGKGTFFNYFPSKDHLLLAFGDMQLAKLQRAVDFFGQNRQSMPLFLRTLATDMTAEPARNPSIVRVLLQANLSSGTVREGMRENHVRAQAILTRLILAGQERGEVRQDLPAADIAQVFRQTVFGTLLLWSVFADASLPQRIQVAFDLLWGGLAPRAANATPPETNSSPAGDLSRES